MTSTVESWPTTRSRPSSPGSTSAGCGTRPTSNVRRSAARTRFRARRGGGERGLRHYPSLVRRGDRASERRARRGRRAGATNRLDHWGRRVAKGARRLAVGLHGVVTTLGLPVWTVARTDGGGHGGIYDSVPVQWPGTGSPAGRIRGRASNVLPGAAKCAADGAKRGGAPRWSRLALGGGDGRAIGRGWQAFVGTRGAHC